MDKVQRNINLLQIRNQWIWKTYFMMWGTEGIFKLCIRTSHEAREEPL